MANKRAEIIAQAEARLGTPYQLDPPPDGINTLDCSLYVLQVAKAVGLPYSPGVRTAEQIRQASLPIQMEEVKAGDLLFFENTYDSTEARGPDGNLATHIGISRGRGTQRMLNSLAPVAADIDISTDYWQERLFDYRRIPGLVDDSTLPNSRPVGIDVSNHQGVIDWSTVFNSGLVDFAFIKCTEGDDFIDARFRANWEACSALAIPRGAYHFLRPDSKLNTVDEADHFLQNIGPLQPGDLVVLDVERTHPDGEPALFRYIDLWMEEITNVHDLRPLIYTGACVANWSRWPEARNYPLWLAAYQDNQPSAPAPWTEVAFWQYTDEGTVPGISGKVDRNRYIGSVSLNKFRELFGLKGDILLPPQTNAYIIRPGDVGSGILGLMKEDKTEPAMPSVFLPLGRSPATVEECLGLNGTIYRWHLPTGKRWRYRAQ